MHYSPEYYNDLTAEEKAYTKWEREKKNEILAMRDPRKKQAKWSELFPVMTLNNEYLNSKDLVF